MTVENVLGALAGVKDPATGRDIVADQVSDVRVGDAGEVTLKIDLISPGFPPSCSLYFCSIPASP